MSEILDLDALIEPIPGDMPAGVPMPDMLRFELDELRKDADPLDPTTAGRRADWNKIVKLTTDALTRTSKDFLIASRLLEAVTRKHGLAGLAVGLKLMARLTTECWDRIHPIPEEGETMEVREGAFKWLNDNSRGSRFPQSIAEQPVAKSSGRGYSYIDWITPEKKPEFEENISRLDPAFLKKSYEDLEQSMANLKELAAALDERMGADVAPDFLSPENSSSIGAAIRNSTQLVETLAKQRGVILKNEPSVAEDETSGSDSTSGQDNPRSVSDNLDAIPHTRESLYGQISRIALALKRIEPHSPIPYMLERCVRLGSLPFPELMRAMVREVAALDELDRLIGVEKKEENS